MEPDETEIRLDDNQKGLLGKGQSNGEDVTHSGNDVNEKFIKDDVTPDDILIELGGCGSFQMLLSFTIQFMMIVVCWGLGTNAFFAYVPKWRCVDYNDTEIVVSANSSMTVSLSTPSSQNNTTWINTTVSQIEYWNKQCKTMSGEKCSNFEFENSIHTLVSEFDLVCDQSWVTASIISIQMIGMMVGCIVVGNVSDLFGRKKPLMMSMLLIFIFQLVCYFSINWQMLAAGRFFIGIGSAFFLSTYCVIQGEYTLSKWRSTTIGFPTWSTELIIFTFFAWLLHNWEYITLIIALGSLAFLPLWFFIPESFRWLIARDRSKEAKRIVKRISKWNKKEVPDYDRIVRAFSEHHKEKVTNYSYLVLFRRLALLKITLPLLSGWFSLGFIGYGIGFGIKKLSGDFFLNMLISNLVAIPSKTLSLYLQVKIGRKYTIVFVFTLCFIGGLVVGIVQYIDTPLKGGLTKGFAFLAIAGLDGAWGPLQTLAIELYPTVVRNTGFSFLSTMTRIGAIIGPQFVYLEEYVSGLLYFMVASLSALSILCILCLPETMNTTLVDKLSDHIDADRKVEKNVCASNRR